MFEKMIAKNKKSNNKAIQIIGSVYAEENGWKNCLVLNTNKEMTGIMV